MKDEYNLKRFVTVQKSFFEIALQEVKNGNKTSHWMWFIFPQFEGLGESIMANKYAIKSEDEAKAYLNHEVLGPRLIEITTVLLELNNLSAQTIFGNPDNLKLQSSMTLFSFYSEEENVFREILSKYFKNESCEITLRLLKK